MFGQVHAWHGLELSAAAEPSMLLALHVVQANPTSRHHEGASRVFRGARGADPHALRAGAVKCSHGCSFPVASALPSSLVVPVSHPSPGQLRRRLCWQPRTPAPVPAHLLAEAGAARRGHPPLCVCVAARAARRSPVLHAFTVSRAAWAVGTVLTAVAGADNSRAAPCANAKGHSHWCALSSQSHLSPPLRISPFLTVLLCCAAYVLKKPDVYFVTMQQLVAWLKDPVPAERITPAVLGCGNVGGAGPGGAAAAPGAPGPQQQRPPARPQPQLAPTQPGRRASPPATARRPPQVGRLRCTRGPLHCSLCDPTQTSVWA